MTVPQMPNICSIAYFHLFPKANWIEVWDLKRFKAMAFPKITKTIYNAFPF